MVKKMAYDYLSNSDFLSCQQPIEIKDTKVTKCSAWNWDFFVYFQIFFSLIIFFFILVKLLEQNMFSDEQKWYCLKSTITKEKEIHNKTTVLVCGNTYMNQEKKKTSVLAVLISDTCMYLDCYEAAHYCKVCSTSEVYCDIQLGGKGLYLK